MQDQFRRRHLPHWDIAGATFFVTTCLEGSIPAQGLVKIQEFKERLERQARPCHLAEREWGAIRWKRLFQEVEGYLDLSPAVRHFEDERLASQVQESIQHFADQRYQLFSYAIMPSHVHWVFRPLESWVASLGDAAETRTPRQRIMQSLKGYTARICNQLLEKSGKFWQDESYDHVVRDEEELDRICAYVESNPVTARLVRSPSEWKFSSAYGRNVG